MSNEKKLTSESEQNQNDQDVMDILDAMDKISSDETEEMVPSAFKSEEEPKAKPVLSAKAKSPAPVISDDSQPAAGGSTFIGATTSLKGDISVEGDIDVRGDIIGNVTSTQAVTISGNVEGNIDGHSVELKDSAVLKGDMRADGKVLVQTDAVHGIVFADEVEVYDPQGNVEIRQENGEIVIVRRIGQANYSYTDGGNLGDMEISIDGSQLRIERNHH